MSFGLFPDPCTAVWEFSKRNRQLPTGTEGQVDELAKIAEELRVKLGVNEKVTPSIDAAFIE